MSLCVMTHGVHARGNKSCLAGGFGLPFFTISGALVLTAVLWSWVSNPRRAVGGGTGGANGAPESDESTSLIGSRGGPDAAAAPSAPLIAGGGGSVFMEVLRQPYSLCVLLVASLTLTCLSFLDPTLEPDLAAKPFVPSVMEIGLLFAVGAVTCVPRGSSVLVVPFFGGEGHAAQRGIGRPTGGGGRGARDAVCVVVGGPQVRLRCRSCGGDCVAVL